jgi:hypothetical protein
MSGCRLLLPLCAVGARHAAVCVLPAPAVRAGHQTVRYAVWGWAVCAPLPPSLSAPRIRCGGGNGVVVGPRCRRPGCRHLRRQEEWAEISAHVRTHTHTPEGSALALSLRAPAPRPALPCPGVSWCEKKCVVVCPWCAPLQLRGRTGSVATGLLSVPITLFTGGVGGFVWLKNDLTWEGMKSRVRLDWRGGGAADAGGRGPGLRRCVPAVSSRLLLGLPRSANALVSTSAHFLFAVKGWCGSRSHCGFLCVNRVWVCCVPGAGPPPPPTWCPRLGCVCHRTTCCTWWARRTTRAGFPSSPTSCSRSAPHSLHTPSPCWGSYWVRAAGVARRGACGARVSPCVCCLLAAPPPPAAHPLVPPPFSLPRACGCHTTGRAAPACAAWLELAPQCTVRWRTGA